MGDIPALIAEGRRLIAQATPGPVVADDHGVVRAGPVRHYTRGSGRSQLLAVMMVELGDSDTAEAMLSRRIADTALFPFAVNNLPALLDVAEAGDKIAGYLEEEMLDAKTCVGQYVVTGEPCEWHKMLLALDSALSRLRGVRS